jgi:hypothetical protein
VLAVLLVLVLRLSLDNVSVVPLQVGSVQLDGVALDNFSELKSIEGLKEGSVIKLVDG